MNNDLLNRIDALIDAIERQNEKGFKASLYEADKIKLLEQVNLNLEINRDYLSEINYKMTNIEQMLSANHLATIKEIKNLKNLK